MRKILLSILSGWLFFGAVVASMLTIIATFTELLWWQTVIVLPGAVGLVGFGLYWMYPYLRYIVLNVLGIELPPIELPSLD